jgi:hypothetical protein
MTEAETLATGAPIHVQRGELSEARPSTRERPTGDPLDETEPTARVSQAPGVPAEAIRHGCGRWWTGARVAHCGGCHAHFSGTTAFDQHQRGTQPGTLCRDPAEVGLVAAAKPYGVLWSWPDDGRNPHAAKAGPDA